MKKLELLYAHEAWLKSSFDTGRYLRGDEVVGADGKCQWRSHNVRVVGDLVILFTEAGCVAVCRVAQPAPELQWPENAPAWANVVLASKDDMSMRIFAEDFRDGARAVGVNAGQFVPGSRIKLSTNHGWLIVASRPGWVPERTAREHCFRPEIAAAYYGAKSLNRMLATLPDVPATAFSQQGVAPSAPWPPAQGPFAVFKDGVFQSSHLSMQSAEASAKRSAGKSPGDVYTIYRPFRTIKGEITVKDI